MVLRCDEILFRIPCQVSVINYPATENKDAVYCSTCSTSRGSTREESSGIWSMLETFTVKSEIECLACSDISRRTAIARASRVSISETYGVVDSTHTRLNSPQRDSTFHPQFLSLTKFILRFICAKIFRGMAISDIEARKRTSQLCL